MRRLRIHARAADIVHLQWLSVPDLDRFLLPDRARAFTVHYPLPASRRRGARQRALLGARWTRSWPTPSTAPLSCGRCSTTRRVHRIPHGAFNHLTEQPDERPLPAELAASRAR